MHVQVNHAKGQFSKRNAEGVVVSTNAIEGMLLSQFFSRCLH